MTEIDRIIKTNPPLTEDDWRSVQRIASEIRVGEQPTEGEHLPAEYFAAQALASYRIARAAPVARLKASLVPVRKAVRAGDGGGRYYWRIVLGPGNNGWDRADKAGVVLPAITNADKKGGTLAQARKAAEWHIVCGRNVVELIPPDIEEKLVGDEMTENRANFQRAGMNVRQRTKKH